MRNCTYGSVRGWKTKVVKLLRFPPTRLRKHAFPCATSFSYKVAMVCKIISKTSKMWAKGCAVFSLFI